MINIFADRPNLVIASVSKAFVDSGISAINTRLVQQIGGSFLTYDPSSDLNPITSFEKGKAYIIDASQNQDLTGIVTNALPADFVITPGINVLGGQYFAGIATTTSSFSSMGLDATKISIIWLVDGDFKSFVPGEDINAIVGIEVNKCYYGFALVDQDLSDYFIPPIVIPNDVEAPTDTYKYYGTEATSDKGYYNVPVRFFADEASLPATGIENIVYVAKAESTSWYWDGAVYQPIGGGGGITTETDPTVDAIIKAIPVSADAATNKYLNWNGSAYTRKQIAYSEIASTPDLSLKEDVSNKSTNTALGTSDSLYPSQKAVKTYVDHVWDANAGGNEVALAYQAMGSSIIAQTLGYHINNFAASTPLSSGQYRMIPIFINSSITVTGIAYYLGASGVFTADAFNGMALYSFSAGVLTQVAITSNDGNIWKATIHQINKTPFVTPYNAVKGLYFILALYHSSAQTTAPSVPLSPSNFNQAMQGVDFTNSSKLTGLRGGQTSLPSTENMSNITLIQQVPWMAVY